MHVFDVIRSEYLAFDSEALSFCVMVFDNKQVSLVYNGTDFTDVLNILSLVRLEICVLLHVDCSCPQAAVTLLSLFFTLRRRRSQVVSVLVYYT